MNRCYQLNIILLLLLLSITACAGNNEQESMSTPTTVPTSAPTNMPASTPTSIPTSTPTAAPTEPGPIELEQFQGVIFTAEQIAASPYWPNNDESWTPSQTDVLALEEHLASYLLEESPNLWQKLERYTRQYWGTVTPDGNRAVYANFFCDAERISSYMDWRADRVEIMDGGDCYFQTIYDVENGRFVWLAINGEA